MIHSMSLKIALLVVVTLLVCTASATCDCGYGVQSALSNAQNCLCNCLTNYQRPNCYLKTGEMGLMKIYVTLEDDITSEQLAIQLQAGTSADLAASEITFVLRESNTSVSSLETPGTAVMQFSIAAQYHQRIVDDVANNAAWTVASPYRLTKAEVVVKLPSDTRTMGSVEVYSSDQFTIYLSDLAWLFGAVGVLLFVCGIEKCAFNNEINSKHDDNEDNLVGGMGGEGGKEGDGLRRKSTLKLGELAKRRESTAAIPTGSLREAAKRNSIARANSLTSPTKPPSLSNEETEGMNNPLEGRSEPPQEEMASSADFGNTEASVVAIPDETFEVEN